MVDTVKTRSLFEPLISRPPLTDQLLQRPPFKFIHDVVNETVRATGVLSNLFTADDLDHTKAGADKTSKIAFLSKLIDGLNIDGTLDDVKPARIVAGKDPEMTNLLLQRLAIEASNSVKPTKHRSKSKDKTEKDKKEKKSKSSDEPKKKSKKTNGEKERSKSKDKSDKEKKEKKHKSKDRHSSAAIDAEERPPINSEAIYGERESSGGTSKGGDDSGIAEETGAESERHDLELHSRESSGIGQSRSEVLNLANHSMDLGTIVEPPFTEETEPVLKRPTTAAARPQTAVGRPGTAAARPAPPKVKKTKIADLDTTAVSQQTSAFDKSLLLMEEPTEAKKEQPAEDFIVEDEEEFLTAPTLGTGADISELTQGSEHGQLVNRIIENTRKLEDDAGAFLESNSFYDLSEQKKMRAEIEAVQRSLQTTAQNTNPLARSLDFIVEDFDLMLKEIEDNRKIAAQFNESFQNKIISEGHEIASLSSLLRSLNNDIKSDDDAFLPINVDRSLVDSEHRRSLWKMITEDLIEGNLFKIMKALVQFHRDINPTTKTIVLRPHFSLYRDILFVAIDHFKHNVDREQFDRMYDADYRKFSVQVSQLLEAPDKPPKPITIACRRIFLPLDMC
uniref:Uncharacterized protein n=1 Tax=Panagrolaimus sp. JU765 TaxID=591449 RepID=A0AC34RIW0_9BILA